MHCKKYHKFLRKFLQSLKFLQRFLQIFAHIFVELYTLQKMQQNFAQHFAKKICDAQITAKICAKIYENKSENNLKLLTPFQQGFCHLGTWNFQRRTSEKAPCSWVMLGWDDKGPWYVRNTASCPASLNILFGLWHILCQGHCLEVSRILKWRQLTLFFR